MADFTSLPAEDLTRQKLLAGQLFIQRNLGRDLSLKKVADAAGSSEYHFHRLFKDSLGETVKQYVDRLRVEKSLYDIRISDLNLLQIAYRYGFKNPETYTRTFKRHFGSTPSHFLKERHSPELRSWKDAEQKPEISLGLRASHETDFIVTRLAALHLAFIRHIGPYEAVPFISAEGSTPWRHLEEFVTRKSLAPEPFIYIGLPQDSPQTTDVDKLRFDMCLLVNQPFDSVGEIGCQQIPGGYYGVLTHAGPYATLADSYMKLFQVCAGLKSFTISPAAPFELLINIEATSMDDHTWTELYLPLTTKIP